MQTVHKTHSPAPEKRRLLLLAGALILLAVIAAAAVLMRQEEASDWPESVPTGQTLFAYAPEQISRITIRRREEAPWTLTQKNGLLALEGDAAFPLSDAAATALLDAACNLPCEAVLTDDPAEYSDHLADFGLDSPRYEAVITYTDGVTAHLSIGIPGADNNAWYYMTLRDDPRLFSFSRGMVEALFVSRDSLRDTVTPVIHKTRIDRITLTGPDSVIEWQLQGSITDPDAIDKWFITQPYSYPADADAMSRLLSNLANLRLGAYVCPATAENLTAMGFDAPRVTIDVHMAAGAIAVNNAEGAVDVTDYPATSLTFAIGGRQNDLVDYIRFGDDIYVSSHFTIGMFIDYNVSATMSRYPVLTALGNLASLTVRTADTQTEYVLTRTEQVAANNELLLDEDGTPTYDVTLTCNGQPASYEAFRIAYEALMLTTVSGTLPEDAEITTHPHTVFTFTDVDDTVHTVALADFDALHDAVIVDGHAAFYLIKGGFRLKLD